jgi:hypothetical protein
MRREIGPDGYAGAGGTENSKALELSLNILTMSTTSTGAASLIIIKRPAAYVFEDANLSVAVDDSANNQE